jgi:hypothetical protein
LVRWGNWLFQVLHCKLVSEAAWETILPALRCAYSHKRVHPLLLPRLKIPLAKKLSDCGVFGVSSDEYLNYAQNNLRLWERKGEKVVQEFREAVLRDYGRKEDKNESLA